MTQTKLKNNVLKFATRNTGYRFTEQDPAMVELCALIDQSQMSIPDICKAVGRASSGAYYISQSTLYNWLNGKTKRPQNFGMTWVGYALGVERKWTSIR